MWLLVIVVTLMPHVGFVIHSYDTEELCIKELARIEADMKEAYPGEDDYVLECRPQLHKRP